MIELGRQTRRCKRFVVLGQGHERFAGFQPGEHVFHCGNKAVTAATDDEIPVLRYAGERLCHLRSRLKIDQRRHRRAVAAPSRNVRRADGVGAALGVEHDDRMDRARFGDEERRIAALVGKL